MSIFPTTHANGKKKNMFFIFSLFSTSNFPSFHFSIHSTKQSLRGTRHGLSGLSFLQLWNFLCNVSQFSVLSFSQVIRNSSGCNLAVDIWSLGCTVLEMATTKPPWSQYEGVSYKKSNIGYFKFQSCLILSLIILFLRQASVYKFSSICPN